MILINQQVIDSMDALAYDCLECGLPRKEILDCIKKLGQRCLEEELYEFMPEVHRLYNELNIKL